jgi:hypothetical protein
MKKGKIGPAPPTRIREKIEYQQQVMIIPSLRHLFMFKGSLGSDEGTGIRLTLPLSSSKSTFPFAGASILLPSTISRRSSVMSLLSWLAMVILQVYEWRTRSALKLSKGARASRPGCKRRRHSYRSNSTGLSCSERAVCLGEHYPTIRSGGIDIRTSEVDVVKGVVMKVGNRLVWRRGLRIRGRQVPKSRFRLEERLFGCFDIF